MIVSKLLPEDKNQTPFKPSLHKKPSVNQDQTKHKSYSKSSLITYKLRQSDRWLQEEMSASRQKGIKIPIILMCAVHMTRTQSTRFPLCAPDFWWRGLWGGKMASQEEQLPSVVCLIERRGWLVGWLVIKSANTRAIASGFMPAVHVMWYNLKGQKLRRSVRPYLGAIVSQLITLLQTLPLFEPHLWNCHRDAPTPVPSPHKRGAPPPAPNF